jgi:SET and MYND domain-containing protein
MCENGYIDVGEVLFYEKPYCSILLPEYQNSYCDYCYQRLMVDKNFKYINITFCESCINVLYCSKECKIRGNEYHKHECSILNILFDLGIAHLAYRIISKTNSEFLIENFSEKIKQEVDLESFYNSQKPYKSSDYETIFNLVTNSSQTHVDDLYQYTLTAILLSKLYFLNEKTKENVQLIATLLCRHIQQTICNAHAITMLNNNHPIDNTLNTFSVEQIRFATAIYPTVSLMNHSCSPNVISSFKVDSNEIIVKSSKKILIEDGDIHIWNCYGPHYLKMSHPERKSILMEQYHFNCECKFCLVESDNFQLNENNISNFGFKCLNFKKLLKDSCCGYLKLDLNDYVAKLKTIKRMFNNSDIKSLIECLTYYESLFMNIEEYEINKTNVQNSVYLINYCKLLDKLARFFCESMNFMKASGYLEKSIYLLKFIYQEKYNIEIAMELFKLSEILYNCGNYKKALVSINEAIEINEKILNENNQLSEQFQELKKNILLIISK